MKILASLKRIEGHHHPFQVPATAASGGCNGDIQTTQSGKEAAPDQAHQSSHPALPDPVLVPTSTPPVDFIGEKGGVLIGIFRLMFQDGLEHVGG